MGSTLYQPFMYFHGYIADTLPLIVSRSRLIRRLWIAANPWGGFTTNPIYVSSQIQPRCWTQILRSNSSPTTGTKDLLHSPEQKPRLPEEDGCHQIFSRFGNIGFLHYNPGFIFGRHLQPCKKPAASHHRFPGQVCFFSCSCYFSCPYPFFCPYSVQSMLEPNQ